MKKLSFLFLLLVPLLLLSKALQLPENTTDKNSTIFVIFNSSDCNNCLKHGYSIINQLLEQSNDPKRIIFLMTEKRQAAKDNEKADLKELVNLQKVTLLWNDEISIRIRKAAKVENELSSIAIYDDKANKFVYSSAIKSVTSFDQLKAYIK